MPIYAYKCPSCVAAQDVLKRIKDLDLPEACGSCGAVMDRLVVAPAVRGDYPGYNCPITGDWIEGRKAHAENLKKHGCRVYEPGETDQAKAAAAFAEKQLESSIESTVEEFIEKLPTRKREQLATELESGADVGVVRT